MLEEEATSLSDASTTLNSESETTKKKFTFTQVRDIYRRDIKTDWNGLSFLRFSIPAEAIHQSLASWHWPTLPAQEIPWPASLSISDVQGRLSTLLLELGRGPGSLYDDIVNEPPDLTSYPECEWDAEVRLGEDLCISEKAFIGERKRKMRAAFARLMGVPEREVDERDLPIVAIAGSGGG